MQWKLLKTYRQFSVPLLGVHLLTFFNNAFDQLFIAAALNPTAVGAYGMSRRLTRQPAQMLSLSIRRVLFPILRQKIDANDNSRNMLKALRTSVQASVMIGTVPLFYLATTADDIIPLLLGPDWSSAVPLISVLAIGSSLMPLSAVVLAGFRAKGRTDALFKFSLARAIITVIIMISVISVTTETIYVAIAISVMGLIFPVLSAVMLTYTLKLPTNSLVWDIIKCSIPASCAAIGAYVFAQHFSLGIAGLLTLKTGVGFVIWLLLSLVFTRKEFLKLTNILLRKTNQNVV